MIEPPRQLWRTWALDCLLLFFGAALLIGPLWRVKYLDNWGSIESIFISDARFLRDHGLRPLWQPDWYCGTRWDYIYPPALRYGTALIALYPNMTTARAYHIYTAFFYSLGIMGVYFLVRMGSGARRWAVVAAAASALLSPCFLFFKDIYLDAGVLHYPPQRLNVLVRYGEGPHMTAFALIPIALGCAWLGLRRGRPGWLALAGLASALVVSNNFYGATSLVLLFPCLAWALWITEKDHWIWLRAAAVGAITYGLTAFWLVPSYISITLLNMRHVSRPGNAWSRWVALAVVVALAILTWRWAKCNRARAWPVFVITSGVIFTVNVLGNQYFNFRVIGEPGRLIPEFDLCFILLVVLVLEHLRLQRRWLIILAVIALWPARHYVRHAWEIYPRGDVTGRMEYHLSEWLHQNLPGQRVLAVGSLRFWYNAWSDGPMLGGGSEQGMLNQYTSAAMYQSRENADPTVAVGWMRAMGTDAVIVHDDGSQNVYRDFVHPRKFDSLLQVIYDSGHGDRVFVIPHRFAGRARVVDAARLDALPHVEWPGDNEWVKHYAAVLEEGPDSPVDYRHQQPELIQMKLRAEAGQSLVVQETFDPSWHAYSNGRQIPIREAPLQFMRIDVPPGEQSLELRFELPEENKRGRVLTAISLIAVAALAFAAARRTG